MGYAKVLLSLLLAFALAATTTKSEFTCNTTNATCKALIDYVSPNTTTLRTIQTLFQVKKLHDILGANSNFSASTLPTHIIAKGERVKIPFPCACSNGTGVSNRTPKYKVVKDDGLYHIAAEVFMNLVTYPEIAKVNGIADVNKIEVGQELWIPLPCSCDDVGGVKVVHYGYVVEAGNTLAKIAEEYGTTESVLLKLNSMTLNNNASLLKADQVLDVPLTACTSNVNSTSLDYPLLVANGTYIYTAEDCVKCSCGPVNNYTLQCEQSGLKPSGNWSTCPSTQCSGTSLYISNVTSPASCNVTTCSYIGYTDKTILTSLVQSTCSAPNSGLQGLSWNPILLFVSVHLIFLCLHLLQ